MKKLLTLFLVAAMVFAFAACGQKEDPADDKIVIGLSEPSLGWPYIAAYVEEFNKLIPEYENVEAVVLSADGNIEKQTNDINDLIVQKVDIILVCSLDGEAVIPALAQAHDAGIPVLAVSNEPGADGKQYLSAYTGPDDYKQGEIAASIMLEALGYADGTEEEINVVVIEGTAGQSTTQLRTEGWNKYMSEHAPNAKIMDAQPCDWDSALEKSAMQAFLTKYGDKIDGVFSQGSGAATAEVVAEAGYEIPVVCTGLSKATFEAIQSGILYGTMAQSPYIDAKLGIETAIKIVKGELDTSSYQRYIIDMPIATVNNISEHEADY